MTFHPNFYRVFAAYGTLALVAGILAASPGDLGSLRWAIGPIRDSHEAVTLALSGATVLALLVVGFFRQLAANQVVLEALLLDALRILDPDPEPEEE